MIQSDASRRLHGLYAITSASLCADTAELNSAVAAALRGGARLIQYREKTADVARREAQARSLLALCREHSAVLIINDDVALAERINADGVHLGAADAPLREARARLGPDAILGASCGPDLQRALDTAAHADYVALGRFFDSRTKPGAPQAALELIHQVRAAIRIPICVIGGLQPDNAAPLIRAGADMVAAIEGMFGNPEVERVEAAAAAYSELFLNIQAS